MHLLLVEDDERLARALTRLLEEDRHVVEHAPDGRTGLELASAIDGLDAVILDIGLPDMSGLDVARRLRHDQVDVSILMLTARDTVNDRVTGLDAGADDYVVKPFAFDELLARLRAIVRRRYDRADPVIRIRDLEIDTRARRARRAGQAIGLSAREYALLEYLAHRAGDIVSRTELWDHAYDEAAEPGSNVLDVHISHLRKKIDDGWARKLIHTRRGQGYVLGEDR
jgi:DNA-binding response OmpR family regulator